MTQARVVQGNGCSILPGAIMLSTVAVLAVQFDFPTGQHTICRTLANPYWHHQVSAHPCLDTMQEPTHTKTSEKFLICIGMHQACTSLLQREVVTAHCTSAADEPCQHLSNATLLRVDSLLLMQVDHPKQQATADQLHTVSP